MGPKGQVQTIRDQANATTTELPIRLGSSLTRTPMQNTLLTEPKLGTLTLTMMILRYNELLYH